jgi:hypothetical protein
VSFSFGSALIVASALEADAGSAAVLRDEFDASSTEHFFNRIQCSGSSPAEWAIQALQTLYRFNRNTGSLSNG